MSFAPTPVSGLLHEYMLSVSLREPEIMRELRAETARHEQASMQIGPEQGAFMALLTELLGVRRYLPSRQRGKLMKETVSCEH